MSGGSTQTNSTSMSPWMEEAAKSQLGKATALTDINQNPYKQYEGQRIAEFNPMQTKSFQGIENLQGSGAIGQGIDVAGQAAGRALGTSYTPYQTGQFGAQAGQYMDPYMQNVVDIQQREAQRQADIAGTQRGANAVKSGAFGGSRQAIMDAEAARNLATQKGDIQARGLQDAYTRAQQQFNTEQALGEASRQYGAGLGMQGLQTALSGASQLGGLGSTQFGQQKDVLGLQQVAGAQQQAQEQAKLSQGYEDFLAKEKYPYQQLEFMSNIMRGTPYGSTTTMYSPGVSTGQQLLGAGTMLAGAYLGGGGKFWKEGGLATAYAAGGSVDSSENIQSIVDNLSDAQLQQAANMAQARGDVEQANIIQQEMASRAALRSGASAMPEDQGIGQLPAGDMTYANGGIIAFADGGDVERYAGMYGSLTGEGAMYDPSTGVPVYNSANQDATDDRGILERIGLFNPENRRALERAEKAAAQKQSAMPYNKATMPAAGYTRTDPRAAGARTFEESIKAVEAAPSVDTGRKTPGAGLGDVAAANGMSGYAGLDVDKMVTDSLAAAGNQPHPQEQAIKEIGEAGVNLKKEEAAGLEAIHQQFNDIFKGRRERHESKDADIKEMATKNLGASIFAMGAGIAAGKSLGEAAEKGSTQYMAGLDKINSAKEKLADARDRLEELEAQRGEMTAREKLKSKTEIKSAEISAKKDLVAATMDMYKVNRETALKIVDQKIKIAGTVYEQQQENARNAARVASANRTPGEIQMIERIMAEKKIPFSEALSYFSGAKREGITEEKLRGEWLDSAKRMQIAQDYPNVKTFEDYKTVMGVGGGGGGFKLVGVR